MDTEFVAALTTLIICIGPPTALTLIGLAIAYRLVVGAKRRQQT